MPPLTTRNANAKGPLLTSHHNNSPHASGNTPRVGLGNNENITPNTAPSKLSSAARMRSHGKPSIARSGASTPSHAPYQNLSPMSRLPRRAETPTTAKDAVTITSRSQVCGILPPLEDKTDISLQPATLRKTSLDKPLPSRPMATHVNELSPTKHSRLLIDASELPLRTSPGTPQEEEWPTLEPIRRALLTMAPTSTEEWVRVSARYELPLQGALLAAASDQKDAKLLARDGVEERSTPTPLRSSDSNDSTDYGQDSDRTHSPPPMSFSQPRVKQLVDPSTPRTPSHTRSSHHATASRIPIYEPKKTPNIIDIKARSTIETPRLAPTLGERLLGPQADLAAVENLRKPRQLSSRMLRKGSSDSVSLAKRASLANMRQSTKKLPTVARKPDTEYTGPDSDTSSERSSVRVNHISGQLLSSSFPGSTLTISDEADRVIYGTPEKATTEERGNEPHINAGTGLEFSVSVTAPDSSSPIEKTMQSTVGHIMSAKHGTDVLPGATITTRDQNTLQHITATLSFLEGTPPAETTPIRDGFLDFASKYGKSPKMSQGLHPPDTKEAAARSSATLTPELRRTDTALPRPTVAGAPRMHNPSDRVPSYMSPTPASEARRVSNTGRLNPNSFQSTGQPSRAPSKASTLTTDENRPNSPRPPVRKRSPTNAGYTKAGSSGHAPLAKPSSVLKTTPHENSGALTAPHVEITPPSVPTTMPRTRSRAKSRGMIDNIKGFFTGKQTVPSLPNPAGHAHKASLVSHTGSPLLKRGSLEPVTEPNSFIPEHLTPRQNNSTGETNVQSAALTQMTLALMEEVNSEHDGSKKARMLSLAQVMLDAVSNAREAERSMVSAQQSAEAARMSYEMTQRSVVEMGRLISSSRHMPGLLKKLAAKTTAI